jgi:hypothetical protein
MSRRKGVVIGASVASGLMLAFSPFSAGATAALIPAAATIGGILGGYVVGLFS